MRANHMQLRPMLIGNHTYGYYSEEHNQFQCSHGGWSSPIKLIDDTTCELKLVPSATTYEFIDKIPEEYDR